MYNIGDRVCVKGWQHTGSRSYQFVEKNTVTFNLVNFATDMDKYIGKESTISFINKQYEPVILYELEGFRNISGSAWAFAEQWLEPVDNAEIDIDEEELDRFLNSGE